MSTQVQPLIDYLHQLKRKGETHVHLDDTARKVLREFFLVAKGYKKIGTESIQQQEPKVEISAQKEILPPATLQIAGTGKQQQIQSLIQQAENWQAAKNLNSLHNKLVFSGGNPDADIMFISDAPGYFEETKGHPFAGPAGEKLDGILKAMGLSREEIYITHLVKYRPSMPNQTTANRKPNAEEIATFTPFIDAEINIVNPKIIVAVGSAVAHHLLDSNSSADELRGKFHKTSRTEVPIRVTYHPSYLLQTESHTDKRKIWEDMLSIMEKMNMLISQKQQSFFLPK